MELSEFLLARIAEDEAVARTVIERQGSPGRWTVGSIETFVGATWLAEHIARWAPARVLAECEAKRRIVDLVQRMERRGEHDFSEMGKQERRDHQSILRVLALPYADHPDYDEGKFQW